MVRIIAGEFKGRRVEAVAGDSTRPSSDMLREAFASTVVSSRPDGFEGASMLDAFAGSGAVGIEALSRGAARCLFIDESPKAVSTIESNLLGLGLAPGVATAMRGDAFASASSGRGLPGAPFDIVFLDPPYAVDASDVCGMIGRLAESGALSDGALIAYEMCGGGRGGRRKGKKKDRKAICEDVLEMLGQLGSGFEFAGDKAYGKSRVVYFRYSENRGNAG